MSFLRPAQHVASSPLNSRKTCLFTTDTFCLRSGDFSQSQQSVVEKRTYESKTQKTISPFVASQQVFTVSHNMAARVAILYFTRKPIRDAVIFASFWKTLIHQSKTRFYWSNWNTASRRPWKTFCRGPGSGEQVPVLANLEFSNHFVIRSKTSARWKPSRKQLPGLSLPGAIKTQEKTTGEVLTLHIIYNFSKEKGKLFLIEFQLHTNSYTALWWPVVLHQIGWLFKLFYYYTLFTNDKLGKIQEQLIIHKWRG